MASKDNAPMSPRQWATNAVSTARTFIRAKTGGASTSAHNAQECTGVIQVGGYINSRGNKVAPYERICPYHNSGAGRSAAAVGAGATKSPGNFALRNSFSSDRANDPDDVVRLKQNLAKMNYYQPDPNSEEDGEFHGYPNAALVSAIKRFQQDNNLPANGQMTKGGPTELALNSKFESHGARFEYPVNTDKKQVAVFDGKSLSLYENDKKIKSWGGVAGKKDYQSPQYQNVADKGPLPAGMYIARQSELHHYDDMSWIERRVAPVGLWTRFPGGGRTSWGNAKVSLEPATQNQMHGRGGFTIHGGKYPGSKGCIDLTSQMDDFVRWFSKNGKDVMIQVKYD